MHRMITVPACCPHEDCGESLICPEVKVSRRPSVHLIVEKDGEKDDIYLSSLYDDYRCKEPDNIDLIPGDIVKFYCPHCGRELPFAEKCACKADMVWLGIEDNGRVRICCRKGCHYHSLEFRNSSELMAFMSRKKKKSAN